MGELLLHEQSMRVDRAGGIEDGNEEEDKKKALELIYLRRVRGDGKRPPFWGVAAGSTVDFKAFAWGLMSLVIIVLELMFVVFRWGWLSFCGKLFGEPTASQVVGARGEGGNDAMREDKKDLRIS